MSLQTFRLFVAYLGKDFCGLQAQDNQRSVESELKQALQVITRNTPKLIAAGRTDAGVNAVGQVISVELLTNMTPSQLTQALSTKLPHDLSVWRIDKMPAGFDARRQSIGKRYVYQIYQSLVPNSWEHDRTLHVKKKLDILAMQQACEYIQGEHDFSSFRASTCGALHARRYLWFLSVSQREQKIIIDIRGNAFCLNMVRIIVGTLIEVGKHKLKPSDVKFILEARDRKLAGVTAKPHGLSLYQVYYPDDLCDANIPDGAIFPRYPVTHESWPFDNNQITYGPI